MSHSPFVTRLGRRALLRKGVLFLAAGTAHAATPMQLFVQEEPAKDTLRVGMLTDLHYADKPPAGTRHYREALTKLEEAALQFARDKPRFVVELGDLIDAADSVETEKKWLARISRDFTQISKDRHCVLGNHCVDILRKEEFLEGVGQKAAHYAFDRDAFHFVVLDACYRSDGKPYERKNFVWTDPNIPAAQVDWLKADLKATDKKVIVFAHQRLDVSDNHAVKNAADVRKVLEGSGKVLAVFQGHSHKNDYKEIGSIHYCTLAAMVEGSGPQNNSYSIMDIEPTGTIRMTGHRRQKGYEWKR